MCAVVLHRISASKYAAFARTLLLVLLLVLEPAAPCVSASWPGGPRAASSMLQGPAPSSSLQGSLHRLLAALSALSRPAPAATTAAGELPSGEPVQSSCNAEVQVAAGAQMAAGSSSLRCRFHPNIWFVRQTSVMRLSSSCQIVSWSGGPRAAACGVREAGQRCGLR